MGELTQSAIAGLSVSIALMIFTALLPELGWILGATLTTLGVISLILAFLQGSDSGSIFAVIALGFGLAVEFATLETLVELLAVAVLMDAILLLLSGILEAILEGLEGIFG